MPADRLTPERLRKWPRGKFLLALTAYDYPMGRTLDEAGADLIHVGTVWEWWSWACRTPRG